MSHVSTLEIWDHQNIKDFLDLIATNCDYLTYVQGMTNIIWKTRLKNPHRHVSTDEGVVA